MKKVIIASAILMNLTTFAAKAMRIDNICMDNTPLFYRYQQNKSRIYLRKGTEVMVYRRVRDKHVVRTEEHGLGYVYQDTLCGYKVK